MFPSLMAGASEHAGGVEVDLGVLTLLTVAVIAAVGYFRGRR